jgi:hypothetical protein
MKKLTFLLFLMGLVVGFGAGLKYQAVTDPPIQLQFVTVDPQEDQFSFGRVEAIAESRLAIKEYDFAMDSEIVVIYEVTPQTDWGNINSLDELQWGDDLVVEYFQVGNRRVATCIVKEEPEEDSTNVQEEENFRVIAL